MSRKPFTTRSLVIVGAAAAMGALADSAAVTALPEAGRLPGLLVAVWLVRVLHDIVDERP